MEVADQDCSLRSHFFSAIAVTNVALIGHIWFLLCIWRPSHRRGNRSIGEEIGKHKKDTLLVLHTPNAISHRADFDADGEFWDFTADMAKGDTAYTNMALPAHTDTTYFVRPPFLFLSPLFSLTLIFSLH